MQTSTETELLLKSRWVLPSRLLNEGYQFRHPDMAAALKDLVLLNGIIFADKIISRRQRYNHL